MKKLLILTGLLSISIGLILYVRQTKNKPLDITQVINPLSDKETVEKPQTLTLISTGDIGLVRDINYQIQQRHNPNYPFENIAAYLKNADLTVTNLEGSLIKNCPIVLTGFKFCGQDTNVKGLAFAGIDAASLANNHTTNFAASGLGQTADILKSNGITPFGLDNKIEYIDIKDKKVALIGFVELGNNWAGLNNATVQNVAKLVSEAKSKADIVITSFHWGVEYTRKPTANQINLAHLAIDNGADLVLGNHPHWIQESEVYKDVFITYAQGNTIFDQDWSQKTKEGVIYKFQYQNGRFIKIDEKYTIIEENAQPRFATDEETTKIKGGLPLSVFPQH